MTLDVPTCSFLIARSAGATEVVDELGAHVAGTVEPGVSGPWTSSIVLDTADRRLRAAALDLRLVADPSRSLLVMHDGADATGPPVPIDAGLRYMATDLPDGWLRRRLYPLVGIRALLPIVELRGRETPFVVRNHEGKIVVRATVSEARAVPAGAADDTDAVDLASRVELTGVLGYPKPFAEVRRAMAKDLGLEEATRRLADEAVEALGLDPSGLPSRPDVRLTPGERSGQAARRILRALADIVEANLPGTLDDLDTEFLHDLRVAVRRSRSVLREIKKAFPDEPRRRVAGDLRWIQAVTGPTRDLDVQLLEWEELVAHAPTARRSDLEPVRALLQARRAEAFAEQSRTLRSDEFRVRWSSWRAFLDTEPADADAVDVAGARKPIRKVAARRVNAVYRRMQRMGGSIDGSSPAQDLHDLRKRGKELRYLLELFGGVLSQGAVRPMVTALKALQDVLGRHQDREVQAAQLRDLAPEIAGLPEGGPAALLALGSLIDRLEAEQAAARHEFAARFKAFSKLELPR